MNWLNKKSWQKEDDLYSPKRKVNNKGSREFHHVIGSFTSRKMNRRIEYESLWGECLFYYYLELDPLTARFYTQPVLVPYERLNQQFILEKKHHVPDTLTFRQNYAPHLYQVKGGDSFIEQEPHLYKACLKFCQERGWEYSVVRPKLLPTILKRNVMYIMHYRHPRPYYNSYITEILKKVSYFDKPTIDYLARSFVAKEDFRDILPVIYHLIFLGKLKVNILRPIDHLSDVMLGDLAEDLLPYFKMESDHI